jgi:hypothetical protein
MPLDLWQVSNKEIITNFQMPFKFALVTYLNNILNLNLTDKSLVNMSEYLLLSTPYIPKDVKLGLSSVEDVKQKQKDLWFLLVNGLRSFLI